MWLRKGNPKRETESLQIAVQNNAIRINYIKARIDKTQHIRKFRLCGDKDEMINHKISECSKLAENLYKTRHGSGGGNPLAFFKTFTFDHMKKWYMNNTASALEIVTHKLLWDFDIQTDHIFSVRRSDIIIMKKKRRTVLADHRIKVKESGKQSKHQELVSELKKLWSMKVTIIPIIISAFGTVTKGLLKGLEDLYLMMTGDHPSYYFIENGQNTEKSPEDLRRVDATQTLVQNHQVRLLWKIINNNTNNNNNRVLENNDRILGRMHKI